MNFDLSEEQKLLAEAVGELFEAHATGTRDPAVEWRDYRDLGLLDLPFTAELGGPETLMLVMEAYGRTLARAPYLQSMLLAGRVLALSGAGEALAAVRAGDRQAALCLYEPGLRYRWDAPATVAVRGDAGWVLSGRKVAVLDAPGADLFLVPAATPDGLGLFLAAADTPGLARHPRPTPDGRHAADLSFDAVVLSPERRLQGAAGTRTVLAEAIDGAIAASCSEMVGAMERLLALTTEYLGVRTQFGVAIGSFQALQHRAADMLVAIEQARSMTIYAVSMLGARAEERSVAVAAAKALVNRAARFVGSEAIQLHGGMGLASEYPAGRYFQRLTVLETLLGDTDFLLDQVDQAGGVPA